MSQALHGRVLISARFVFVRLLWADALPVLPSSICYSICYSRILRSLPCRRRSEELFTLVHRSFISNSRNPRAFQARVGQTLVLAIIAGLIFLRLSPDNYLSRSGACTFIVLNQVRGNGVELVGP